MKITTLLAAVLYLFLIASPSYTAAQEYYSLNVEYTEGSAEPYVVMADPGARYTITQPYSWVRDETSRYSLLSYSIDGGGYTDISRKARGDFTLDIQMDSPHTVRFLAVIQYPISVGGSNLAIFSPPSPTHDDWFDLNSEIAISVPYTTEGPPGTREQLVSWSLDRSAANVIASADNESDTFATRIMMSRPHAIDFNTETQHYVDIISEYGTTTPSGWYDAGSAAAISILPPTGEFFIHHKFAGWDGGDVTESSGSYYSGSITVDSPKTLMAKWDADYTQLVLITGVAAAAGAAVILAKKKKAKSANAMAEPVIAYDQIGPGETNVSAPAAELQQSTAAVVMEKQQADNTVGYQNQIMEYALQKSIEKLDSFHTSGMISDAKFSRIKQELEQSFL